MKQKRSYILSLLALVLILCALIQPAWAYFTSSKQADGAIPIYFTRKTTIEEEVTDLTKSVRIQNILPEDYPDDPGVYVWVRARAYTGSQYELSIDGWGVSTVVKGDSGWIYYPVSVPPGGFTDCLDVTLTNLKDVNSPGDVNVAVIYESTTVFYDANGDELAANWNAPLVDSGISTPKT